MPQHDDELIGTANSYPTPPNESFDQTLENPPVTPGSIVLDYTLGDTSHTIVNIGPGDGLEDNFSGWLAYSLVKPGTCQIDTLCGGNPKQITDDGSGNLSGDGTGTVNYEFGTYDVTWDDPPDDQENIDFQFDFFDSGSAKQGQDDGAGGFTGDGIAEGPSSIDYETGEIYLEFDEYLSPSSQILASYEETGVGIANLTLPMLFMNNEMGYGVCTLPGLRGESWVEETSFATVKLPPLQVSAYGLQEVIGIGDIRLPYLIAQASGIVGLVGLADFSLPAIEVSAAGYMLITGSGAVQLPVLAAEARGHQESRFEGYVLRYVR